MVNTATQQHSNTATQQHSKLSEFDQQKQVILQQMEKFNEIIDLILNNQSLDIANHEQINKLRQISNKNKVFQHKLTSNEFEVAIVGLEKAGKSTFANALIDNNVLPSAPERCTFTTTRLVSGVDRAVVEFYTEKEFEQIFRAMLNEINYPDSEEVSFKTMNLEDFTNYFNDLEINDSNLYRAHVGKTNEEIIDILECRNRLRLTGEKIEFRDEQLNQNEFQEYIKGLPDDTSKPRSVKYIEIESSKLQQMKNIIMYDVPGFDSPTKLHIRQTEERLKKADAIILVTNVGTNPSIQGTSLNVIRNNSDEDGISLKDKLFVFGNQIDRVNTEEQITGNEFILRNDVKKHNLGEDKRVFVGSALSYLDKNHQSKFGDKIDNNIDKIRQALTHYYQTERFEILKKKISKNQRDLKIILDEIAEEHEKLGNIDFDENRLKAEISYSESKAIEKRLKVALKDFFAELKNDILKNKWISERMKEELSNEHYFMPIDEEYFYKVQRLTDDSLRSDIQFEKVNFSIRAQLHLKCLEEYLSIIKNVTSEKCKSVEFELNQTFASAVCGEITVTDEIRKQCQSLIYQITKEVSHHTDRFHYLIERFSRDLFDIMLNAPIASQDRLRRYKESSHDIRYLDHYYSQGAGKLITLVLAQKDVDMISFLKQVSSSASSMIPQAEHNKIISLVKPFDELKLNSVTSANFDKLDIELLIRSLRLESSNSAEKVVNEINSDLKNLRSVLIKAVIEAIDLEVAFLNGVDKQIKLLLSAMENKNDYAKIFNRFTSEIVALVKKHEFDNIAQIIERQKIKNELIEKITSI